jgi:hypothetical protein
VKRSRAERFVRVFLAGFMFSVPGIAARSDSLTLSEVHLVGTKRLSDDDVARGLDLKLRRSDDPTKFSPDLRSV